MKSCRLGSSSTGFNRLTSKLKKLAVAFIPKDSLKVSEVGTVYDKSAEMVFSVVGPILSFIIDTPKPKLLPLRGVLTDAALVTGAPSSPTH